MESVLASILLISGRPTQPFTGVPPVVMIAFMAISLALIILGIVLVKKRQSWVQHSQITLGEIVEISKRYERSDKMGQSPIYFPVVSFTVNGRTFKIESETGMPRISQVGEKVEVRFNPENPYESTLGTSNIPGTKPGLFFILGVLLLVASAVLTAHSQVALALK
ncbi:DUF3592 domain-containing protein [Flectobacillus major]|jgi:hypothetical protein|uniref:DUF3592 domain-containing protein n=1 Tax=Flectobacillus major TaxID=103 RepID=UPI0004263990|nr:DUF3592 domain-containing protein [Flectobacillus major]